MQLSIQPILWQQQNAKKKEIFLINQVDTGQKFQIIFILKHRNGENVAEV